MESKEVKEIQNIILKGVNESAMTKGGYKDFKSSVETVIRKMDHKLLHFKEKYITDYTNWSLDQLRKELTNAINTHETKVESKHGFRTINNKYKIDRIKSQLSRPTLLSMEYMVEANESYKLKFANLISKIVSNKFNTTSLKIEAISNSGKPNEFGFLITNREEEIHARVIYACGMIKAPHYRFIITTRKK